MSRLTLGFDLDGVLYPWQRYCHIWLTTNKKYVGDYTELFNSNFFDLQTDTFSQNIIEIEPLYTSHPFEKKNLKTLELLSKKYHIIYITSRPKNVENLTKEYLKKYRLPNYEEIYFSSNKAVEVRAQGCNLFVEDQTNNLKSLINIVTTIKMNQPWNLLAPAKYEINTLQDLEKLLL